jgi:hypothetical protein
MASPSASLDPRKRRAFRLVTLTVMGVLGLAAAECGLRWQQARIDSSDDLAPGLIRPDPDLGWSLTPYWKGAHHHHDFSARYQLSALGLRADTAWPNSRRIGARSRSFVGDSFTFGFGVEDTATFVHRLDRAAPGGHAFGNAAIPGYSTDQQALQTRAADSPPAAPSGPAGRLPRQRPLRQPPPGAAPGAPAQAVL